MNEHEKKSSKLGPIIVLGFLTFIVICYLFNVSSIESHHHNPEVNDKVSAVNIRDTSEKEIEELKNEVSRLKQLLNETQQKYQVNLEKLGKIENLLKAEATISAQEGD